MNDKSKKNKAEPAVEAEVVGKEGESFFAAEMEELKRDMRSAKIIDWIQNNQQRLIAAAVAILLLLAGASLWMERIKSQKESAAALYQQALAESDRQKQQVIFEVVARDYGDTGYGSLAHLYLAKLSDSPVEDLNALIHGSGTTKEIAWQARLDLAEWYLDNGKAAEATALLAEPTGTQYEQLRHYLMAESSTDVAEKKKHLQLSLDSVSNDGQLKSRVESMLAELSKGDQAGS